MAQKRRVVRPQVQRRCDLAGRQLLGRAGGLKLLPVGLEAIGKLMDGALHGSGQLGDTVVEAACELSQERLTAGQLGQCPDGVGIEDRLTGAHETAHWSTFTYGSSDRGASVRIPWAVEKAKKGWLEDRRPNANMDPYVVTRLLIETCFGALAETNELAVPA